MLHSRDMVKPESSEPTPSAIDSRDVRHNISWNRLITALEAQWDSLNPHQRLGFLMDTVAVPLATLTVQRSETIAGVKFTEEQKAEMTTKLGITLGASIHMDAAHFVSAITQLYTNAGKITKPKMNKPE